MDYLPSPSSFRLRLERAKVFARSQWRRYRGLALWKQIGIGIGILFIVFLLFKLAPSNGTAPVETILPSVTVARVDTLAGTGESVSVIGTVRSVTEAAILAQSGGAVTAVSAALGSYVPAGFVIAQLENASQRAAVLQAEGAYEAALAAQTGASPGDIAASARTTYSTVYSRIDTLLTSDVDTLFGVPTAYGPALIINAPMYDFGTLSKERQALTDRMRDYRQSLTDAATSNPATLLANATAVAQSVSTFLDRLAAAATDRESDATPAQLAALAAARSEIASVQTSITTARIAYQGQGTSATAGVAASVKIALGGLRAAQAQLEKTLVRAPIGGTINFLPIRVGDYVAPLTHVATVAQNGALEIVSYISEETAGQLKIGAQVKVEDKYPAVITSIAPALDPVTKQVEVHLALSGKSTLVNGQSVRIAFASSAPQTSSASPLLLPLTALKLTPSARVVFSVGPDDRLVAHTVEIGDVHGDRIEIKTALSNDLQIVTDARGFSEGQKVRTVTP